MSFTSIPRCVPLDGSRRGSIPTTKRVEFGPSRSAGPVARCKTCTLVRCEEASLPFQGSVRVLRSTFREVRLVVSQLIRSTNFHSIARRMSTVPRYGATNHLRLEQSGPAPTRAKAVRSKQALLAWRPECLRTPLIPYRLVRLPVGSLRGIKPRRHVSRTPKSTSPPLFPTPDAAADALGVSSSYHPFTPQHLHPIVVRLPSWRARVRAGWLPGVEAGWGNRRTG